MMKCTDTSVIKHFTKIFWRDAIQIRHNQVVLKERTSLEVISLYCKVG